MLASTSLAMAQTRPAYTGCPFGHLLTGYVPDMMACIFLGYPILYASMYGRFLLLQASCMVLFL